MRCETLGPRLSAWVDGELSWLAAWQVARHVAGCPVCAAEVEELRALNAQLVAANPVENPLFAPPVRSRRPVAPLVGAGALVVAGVAGFFLLPRLQLAPRTGTTGNTAVPLPAPTPAGTVAKASEPPALSTVAPEKGREAAPVARPKEIVARATVKRALRRGTPQVASAEVVRRSYRARRSRPKRVDTTPIVVATAKTERVAFAAEKAKELASLPPDSAVTKPVTPEASPSVAAAEPDSRMMAKKADRGARDVLPPRAVASAVTARRREGEEETATLTPRKKIVPVLVVTPTRYTNAVTVTAAALEVDDTDDSEETPQP